MAHRIISDNDIEAGVVGEGVPGRMEAVRCGCAGVRAC